jgi:hypothetical protein
MMAGMKSAEYSALNLLIALMMISPFRLMTPFAHADET